jgi:hypothetical protein
MRHNILLEFGAQLVCQFCLNLFPQHSAQLRQHLGQRLHDPSRPPPAPQSV